MIYWPYWWFAIPGLILGLYAQIKLSATYGKYLEVENQAGFTGAQAAREILDNAGLADIPVEEIGGRLTDHYSPSKPALFLSSETYQGRSISAVCVAAPRAGPAFEPKTRPAPFYFRMMFAPATPV